MKRLLLFLTCVLTLFGIAKAAEDVIVQDCTFNKTGWSAGTSSYISGTCTFTNSAGFVLNLANCNNSGKTWDYVKIGQKSNTNNSATISTNSAIADEISKIVVNVEKNASSAIVTISLQSSTDGKTWTSVAGTSTVTINGTSVQDVTFDITPTANLYYQLSFNSNNSTSTNGALTVNGIKFYKNESPSVDPPVVTVSKPEIICVNNQVSITCSTANSKIYYTTNGNIPNSSSTEYTSPFSISETTTVKAIAYVGNTPSEVTTQECNYTGNSQGGDPEENTENNVFVLATDVKDLYNGAKVLIVNSTSKKAMGPWSGGNNLPGIDVTINNQTIENPKDVEIITLAYEGTKNGNPIYSFQVAGGNIPNGYLYAASSSANQLKVQNSNDDNSKATITFDNNGNAIITFQGTYTRNLLRYNNATSNGNLFACYSSGQQPVQIYIQPKIAGPEPWISTFAESYDVAKGHEIPLFDATEEHPKMTYSFTSNDNGAIEIKNDVITGITVGTVNVKASWEESEKWTEGSTSFTVYVQNVEAPSAITFDPVSGSDIMAGDLITISANGTPAPEITYCLDNQNDTYLTYTEPISINEAGDHTIYVKAKNAEGEISAEATYSVTKPKVPGVGDEFELVTSTDALEAGKYYVIAFTNSNNVTYVMSEGSKNIPGKVVTLTNNKLIAEETTLILKLGGYSNNWIWEVVNDNYAHNYVTWSDATETSLTANGTVSSVEFDNSGNVEIKNFVEKARYLMGYTSDFRAYQNLNQSGANKIKLYRLVEAKVPALPVVKIGEEILENNESKTILADTQVSFECENAESITVTFKGKAFTNPNPTTFTITESGELEVYGTNEVGDGEKFTYEFTVDTKESFPEVDSNFAQILNGEEPSEGFYVIAKGKESGTQNGIFAMSNIVSTQNTIPATSNITIEQISDNKALLTTTAEDVLIVKLIKESGQNFIKTVNLGEGFTTEQKYLSSGTSSTDLIFSDNETPVYITVTGNNNNNANIQFSVDAGSRKVALGGSAPNPYFNYQTSGDVIQLYKYTTANIFKPEFTDLKLRLGTDETAQIVVPENSPILNYSVDGNCVTIDGNTLNVVETGEAVVTVSWNESDDWFAGSASFNVTVLPPMVDITETFGFRYPTVRGKKDIGVLSQAVYYEGDGKVEYSIWEYKFADPEDKTLISSTDVTIQDDGMIRPEDIKNAVINKVYTVKAIVAQTDLYGAGEASYTFVIEEPVEAPRGNCKDDFSDNSAGENGHWDKSILTSYSDEAYPVHSNITNVDYDIIASLFADNSTLQLRGTYNTVKGKIKFKVPSGCKSITIGKGSTNGGTNPSGTITIGDKEKITFTLDKDYNFSVAGYSGEEICIENTDPGNYALRISYIEYEIPSSDVPEASLSFDVSEEGVGHYINVFEDETISLPKLLHADNLDFNHLIFDIDEIDEADDAETYQGYTITAKDYDDISIDINYPGVYTFRAEYNAAKLVEQGKLENVEKAKFLDGFAILRINVFPRLNVVPSDNHDSSLAEDDRTNAPELTLVQSVEEDGVETALISLPSIEALENSFKYSTIKIVKVEIKHGKDTESYEGDELANLDPEIKFTEDGYVKYTVRYANTEAFQTESIVHVVLMPKTTVDRSEDNKLTLTPSKNAELKYAYVYGKGKKEIKRRATDIPSEDWVPVNGNHVIDDLEGLKNDGVTAIFYKTEKDLSSNQDMVDNKAVPANPILADEGTIVLATVEVTLHMGDIDDQPFKTSSHNYSLDGVITFSGTNETLEYGKDFTVTVTPQDNAEGWTSTSASSDLSAAYKEAFSKIQKGTGLFDQYESLGTEYVDGFYTGVSNVNVTEDTEENSFTVSADLPCSGVYVITVLPVEGSEFTFNTESGNTATFTVYPNLQGNFDKDNGFNIEGFSFNYETDKGGYYAISFPTDYEFEDEMVCYIPGTYFASGLSASSTGYTTPVISADNSAYYAKVDLSSINGAASGNVYVTVTKNGASHRYEFVVNKLGNINESTAVDSIDNDDAEVEYFTIDGIKVDNPVKGIYIVRKGKKTSKVVL